METLEEKKKRKNKEKYLRRKDKAKEYYEKNKDLIAEKTKDRNKMLKENKEKYDEKLKKSREAKRRYREKNKDKIRKSDNERYQNRVISRKKFENHEYISQINRLDLIKKAVDFVNKVESRNGLLSFEELFGELLDISFYLPSGTYDDLPITQQLYDIWYDVKHFANAFEKDLGGFDWDRFKELRKLGLCRYCEKDAIVNTHNTCSKCRGIMVYIEKLG